jgi:hypothetical protein
MDSTLFREGRVTTQLVSGNASCVNGQVNVKARAINTDQFPGDGHEKILDVCRSRLCALTCSARVRVRPWHRSDDVALLERAAQIPSD